MNFFNEWFCENRLKLTILLRAKIQDGGQSSLKCLLAWYSRCSPVKRIYSSGGGHEPLGVRLTGGQILRIISSRNHWKTCLVPVHCLSTGRTPFISLSAPSHHAGQLTAITIQKRIHNILYAQLSAILVSMDLVSILHE